MKHIPIVGKFVVILVVFGVFSLGAVIYATHGMRMVGSEYSHVMNGSVDAGYSITRANRDLEDTRVTMAELMLGPDPSTRARLQAAIAYDEPAYARFMNIAIADELGVTTVAQDLMARTSSFCRATAPMP